MTTINRILIVWIVGNAFLFALGFIFSASHYPIDFDGLNCPKYGNTLLECAMIGFPFGAVTGIIIGVGQAWLLRKYFSPPPKILVFWALATVIGFALGHSIGDSGPIPQFLPYSALIFGTLSGIIVGFLQWLVLRSWTNGAGRWIIFSAIGFGIGLGLFGVLALVILDEVRNPLPPFIDFVGLLVLATLEGVLVGGFWGIATTQVIKRLEPELV
jgi:hypothetical protein